ATIRNVMTNLEIRGLLMAPNTSAGRLPTEQGLRLYVHGLLERGNLTRDERDRIDGQCAASGRSLSQVLEQATTLLSDLSRCAGLVVAPKQDEPLKHIEFVNLGPGRALVVLVAESGQIENRIIDVPVGLPPSSLVEASNFLSSRLRGRSLGDASREIDQELKAHRQELDELTRRLIEAGLADWTDGGQGGALIVRGQAQLLTHIPARDD